VKRGLILFVALAVLSAWSVAFAESHRLKVSVAYADNFHSGPTLPSPWMGSPGVTNFVGTDGSPGNEWEAGAIMLTNPSSSPLTVDSVVVDIGGDFFGTGVGTANCLPAGNTPCDPWNINSAAPLVIPAKGIAILTNTVGGINSNFDSSDVGSQGTCGSPSRIKPRIHVTVGTTNQVTSNFIDDHQVLNTGGVDPIACGATTEGLPWTEVDKSGP
jgi:hypothetical protein